MLLAAAGDSVTLHLGLVDYLILGIYFAFVLGIGWVLRKYLRTSADFFESGRSLPAWVCALGFIGANLGAQEVMGMAASGAKYGIATSHFYWVGAIPAMVFVGVFMMPFYYGSKARSVPEYLKLRFDEKTRTLNALSFAVMTVFSSGISMFALAKLLNAILGWNFHGCIVVSSAIVLVYIYSGGLTSAIYNEVLQFFLIVLGFLPLVILGLNDIGGWSGLMHQLDGYATSKGMPGAWSHSWAYMGNASANPIGIEWFGLIVGLGFVLSFGYWCTDFLVVQRAMAAKDMASARRTPVLAAIPKMLFPALVILPGMLAIGLFFRDGPKGLPLPMGSDGSPDYNMVVPVLLAKYFPNGMLGIGLTALMASFMSGMAGNVTAFNTVWTYDLYQRWFNHSATDEHLIRVGRVTTVVGLLISAGCAYLAAKFNNIMDMLQLVFGFVNAPLFAIFLLGMFWKRATGHGAFFGLIIGTVAAAVFHGMSLPVGETPDLMKGGNFGVHWYFASPMAQNFWMAIVAFSGCFLGTAIISLATKPTRTDDQLRGLVYSLTEKIRDHDTPWYARPAVLGILVLIVVVALNLIFW
ncbi:MAG TPA: sodium:solute symporter family protein [Candidatus Didemnitutus sp.]|nr:sodium:solute symporter family protein [Candidatus Didemnitutus sp.]